jgi:transcriptional regulator with XRE-family HTH domain
MSFMQDTSSTLQELATALRSAREAAGLSVVALAAQAGRARTLVHRLEGGGDVTVSALLDLLRALNLGLRLEPLAPPTLDQVRQRFADLDEDAGDARGSTHG